jgi:hypothetical protein
LENSGRVCPEFWRSANADKKIPWTLLSSTLKGSAHSSLVSTLVFRVCDHDAAKGFSDWLANFKEAGEAKENYDLRKIFDNT